MTIMSTYAKKGCVEAEAHKKVRMAKNNRISTLNNVFLIKFLESSLFFCKNFENFIES